MKTKKQKKQVGDLVGHIVLVSALVGLLVLGYWSLKSNGSDKFQSIERLRGDHHIPTIMTPHV